MPNSKRNYDELKINGPPLFKQGSIANNFASPKKCLHSASCPPLDASTTALLVVDVQPEYWSECPAVRKDFPNFPSRISSLVDNCREQNVKRIIWVRAAYDYEHSPWLHQFTRLHQGRIPPVVEQSSEWEEFAKPLENEIVITKTSWSSTSGNTGLLDILKNDGIESVLVCGLITSVCVQHSAFGVFEAGFRTILVTDACADRGKERHKAALALYGDYMYELRTVSSLYAELKNDSNCKCISYEKERALKKSKSDGSLTSATSSSDGSVYTIDEAEN
jgi:nicotinamidase-related amidase